MIPDKKCRLLKYLLTGWIGLKFSEPLSTICIFRASDRSREKKVKFRGIFRDRFTEKLADFV